MVTKVTSHITRTRVPTLTYLPFLLHSYVVCTDPHDVARVESKTFICTEDKRESIPKAKEGVKGQLGNWMSVDDMNHELWKRYPGCMKGNMLFTWYINLLCILLSTLFLPAKQHTTDRLGHMVFCLTLGCFV